MEEIKLPQLIINELTSEQFRSIDSPNEDQLYFVSDEKESPEINIHLVANEEAALALSAIDPTGLYLWA